MASKETPAEPIVNDAPVENIAAPVAPKGYDQTSGAFIA